MDVVVIEYLKFVVVYGVVDYCYVMCVGVELCDCCQCVVIVCFVC